MGLRKGYKQTEIGVIPEDWEVLSIDRVFNFHSTSNFSKAEMFLNGDLGCLHYGLIHAIPNSIYNLQNGIKYFVTKEQAKYEIIKDGDVIMVDASEDLIGINKSVELTGVGNKKYIAGLHTFLLRDNNSVLVNGYRGAILNSKLIKSQLIQLAVGMKVFGVSKTQLKTVLLPVPTKAEQTAIANALSDADALISSLEKLIEKKRNIKQGAMQQLLKPKKGWVLRKLGEICEIRKGQLITEVTAINGEIPVIAGGKKPSYFHNEANRFNKTITVSGSGANAGFVAFFETPIFASDCSTIEEGSTYSIKYIFYNLQLLQNKIYKAQTGGAQPHIHPSDLAPFEILFPELNIQIAIQEKLSDMDTEIELLEKKLSKSKMLKQGMMQELLTGKIRLI
jgi:type I restriction enzyme S subunit